MTPDFGADHVRLDCACGWRGDTRTTAPTVHLGGRVHVWRCGGCKAIRLSWVAPGVTLYTYLEQIGERPDLLDTEPADVVVTVLNGLATSAMIDAAYRLTRPARLPV